MPTPKIENPPTSWRAIGGIALGCVIFIGGSLYGCAEYNVWSSSMVGRAKLAEAEQSRQIQIAVSKAKADAAEYEAKAEITRARGVATANKIVGDSLAGSSGEAYLRYLWLDKLGHEQDKTVVYIPTNASMPTFLEAGRIGNGAPAAAPPPPER